MHDLGRNEDRLRGTYEFPFEFHHIDSTHPRYVMSYHWHVECEIMRVLQGTLTVTLDEKSFTAKAGDIIFVNSGVLHSGIPHDCIYHYYLESLRKNRRDYKRIVQLKQVVEFIEKNYTNPITLQELSASVSMSPKYFCRFFSEMTHQTPMDYLNRQRIEQACCQLATTGDSITEIAYRNGFNDLSYFIRTFKKYKGVTPGKYKKQ